MEKTHTFFALLLVGIFLQELNAQNYILKRIRDGESSVITLRCNKLDDVSIVADAEFWKKPSMDSPNPELVGTGEEYSFTLTQQLEAYYCCGKNFNGDCEPLVVYPNTIVVVPPPQDFYEIKLGTLFTSLDCGIRPGALSEFYDLEWVKGQTPISNTDPVVHTDNFSLSIVNAVEVGVGDQYLCTVTVEGGSPRTQFVTVLAYSSPEILPNDDLVKAGTVDQLPNYTLTCSATAHTKKLQSGSLSWWHNEKLIGNEGKYSVEVTSPGPKVYGSSLTILGAQMEDSGEYECRLTVTVDDVGNEQVTRTVSYKSIISLAVLTDELELQMDRKPGGIFEFCLGNLPMTLYDSVKVRTRFTSAEESEKTANHFVLTVNLQDSACYDIKIEDIEVPYKSVKVQVAVAIGNVLSPFVPELTEAEPVVLMITTEPPDEESPEPLSKTEIFVIAGCAGVVVFAVITFPVTIFFVKAWKRKSKRKHNRKVEKLLEETRRALEIETDLEIRKELYKTLRKYGGMLEPEGMMQLGDLGDEEGGIQPKDNDNNYVDDSMDDKVGDLNREADTNTPQVGPRIVVDGLANDQRERMNSGSSNHKPEVSIDVKD